jgi:hypothetical protein
MWRTEVKNMEKKTLLIIDLVGGIIAAISVFLAWITASAGGFSVSMSGWDLLRASISDVPYVAVVLVGGILALLGGLGMLATKMKVVGYLLPIGGILALVGGIWGFAKVTEAIGLVGSISGVSVSVGYGVYLGIVGGVLALIGSLSLRSK